MSVLAFVDDLVVVSDSWQGMAANLEILEDFCRFSGLRVQPTKCHGFQHALGVSMFVRREGLKGWLST